MNSYSFFRKLLVVSLATLLGVGCSAQPPTRITPPDSATVPPTLTEINRTLAAVALQAAVSSADYRLSAEDLVQITIFNVPESETGLTPRRVEVRVSQRGLITLPLVGDIQVAGLTTSNMEKLLQERYEKYLHNPQIGVQVKEYRQRVSVIGAVPRPGVFELSGPKTIIDMLALAGGVSENAGSQVHLYRQGPEGRQSYVIDLFALAKNSGLINAKNVEMVNQEVQAGDVINVPQAGMFFVDGAVGRPGSYPLGRRFTLVQALAAAGGVDRELAKISGITIFRRQNPPEVERIPVDLDQILAGKATDPQVQADDVIVVPISTPKYLVRRFLGSIGMGSIPIPR
jgi:polysaccharide export outer membrane protein